MERAGGAKVDIPHSQLCPGRADEHFVAEHRPAWLSDKANAAGRDAAVARFDELFQRGQEVAHALHLDLRAVQRRRMGDLLLIPLRRDLVLRTVLPRLVLVVDELPQTHAVFQVEMRALVRYAYRLSTPLTTAARKTVSALDEGDRSSGVFAWIGVSSTRTTRRS